MSALPLQAASLGFSFLTLFAAGAFFWREKKVAGFAFMVAFIVSFSAVLGQRVVFSSAVVGVTVERDFVTRTTDSTK